jgi:hypothetical protein
VRGEKDQLNHNYISKNEREKEREQERRKKRKNVGITKREES